LSSLADQLSLWERSSESTVSRRACTAPLSHRWRALHCLQALWSCKLRLMPFPPITSQNYTLWSLAPWVVWAIRKISISSLPIFFFPFLSPPHCPVSCSVRSEWVYGSSLGNQSLLAALFHLFLLLGFLLLLCSPTPVYLSLSGPLELSHSTRKLIFEGDVWNFSQASWSLNDDTVDFLMSSGAS